MFWVFCKYLLKDASYGKRHPFRKYSPLKYASIGTIPETIGATVGSVDQVEVMSCVKTRNNVLRFLKDEIMVWVFCKFLLKDASYGKRHPFRKYSPLKYASIGTIPETIGATVESVDQFEVTSFFKTRNNVLRFLEISPKRVILRKKAPL